MVTNNIYYLKKKKMYEILESLVNNNLNIMKSASYRSYRGSEWLECSSKNKEQYEMYKFYHKGAFFSLDIEKFDEENNDFIVVERLTYRMIDGQLVKKYQRTKTYRETEEIKRWIEKHNFE